MKLFFLMIVLTSTWVFSGNALSEKGVFPNIQGSEGRDIQPNTPKALCEDLSQKELVDLCRNLKLEDLPAIKGLKTEDLISFLKEAQGPIATFTNPESFQKITNNPERLVRSLGFRDVAQLKNVQAGAALVVKRVSLEALINFKGGDNPDELMKFPNRIIVPLIIPEKDGTVHQALSSITFGLFASENEWRWTRRGAPNRTRKINEYRKDSQEMLEIPGLNLLFLLERESGEVGLIPLYDAKFENVVLKAGVKQPATQILLELVKEAKRFDPLKLPQPGSRLPLH
ncbi:MAG: hypothetical protein ABI618_03545 [Nitrospirota bacterium]